MNLLGFPHLNFVVCVTKSIFFKKTWLHIGVKFFRSETEFPILSIPCSAAADMSWFIIKRQAKKAFADITRT